jgi:glycine cleavage system H protein
MVIALFILMVVILLTAEYFSFSKKISVTVKLNPEIRTPLSVESVERFFHRGHGWTFVRSSNEVITGVDDFSQRFIGKLEDIELPQTGSSIRQGEVMATMKHGDKLLPVIAPISGTILEVNTSLKKMPSTINDSPLEKGWIVKMVPDDLPVELQNLFEGVTADRWQETVRAHLVQWFSPRLGMVMQDGGELVENVSDLTNGEEWRILVDEFFPNISSNKHNINS